MNIQKFLSGFLLLSIITFPSVTFGQATTTGEIFGVVEDEDGQPQPNVDVVIEGARGARTATTDSKGQYKFEYLPPGSYDLKLTVPGFRAVSIKGIQVKLEHKSKANIILETGKEIEIIEITGSAVPAIDTSKISVSSDLSSDFLKRMPVGRSVSASMSLAPGVSDPGAAMLGNNPSISGASGLENTYIIDGVNITNAGYGSLGSYSIRYGSLGSGVNFDFVETVQVKTAGFEAEYGSALGGVVNVLTKSGTNEFHGSVYSFYQPRDLEATRRPVSLMQGNAYETGYEEWDIGATLGGPLVKDKLFFFAAINPQQRTIYRQVAEWDPNGDGTIDYPLGNREWKTVRSQQAYAAKLSWSIAPGHKLDATLFGDPGRSEMGPQNNEDILGESENGFSEIEMGGNHQVIRYEGVLTDWMSIEAQVARARNEYYQTAKNETTRISDYTQVDGGGSIIYSGGLGYIARNQISENYQYHLKATNYFEMLGRHTVKYGITYEDIGFDTIRDYTGPRIRFTEPGSGAEYETETGVLIRKLLADDGTPIFRIFRGIIDGSKAATESKYIGLFIQDQWAPIENLTLSLGVRAEYQKIIGSELDYTFDFSDNVSPRIGATWDFTGEGRGKIFAHYGRFFEKVPNILAVRLFSKDYGITRADFYDSDNDSRFTEKDQMIAPGETPVEGSGRHFVTVGEEKNQIRPGTKNQYQDELVVGAEYEIFDDWNLGVRWIHREVGQVLEDLQLAVAESIMADFSSFGPYVLANPGTHLNNTCPPKHPNCWVDPERKYDALEITLRKDFMDGWQVFAWYRISQLWGNYEGLFRNDNGQSDPNLTSLFDFPTNTRYIFEEIQALCPTLDEKCIENLPATMDGQGRSGFLNTDRTHMLAISGVYTTEIGLTIGVVGRYQSGTPITGLGYHFLYENAGEIPIGKRGKYGRTKDTYNLDLHLDYIFEIGDGWKAQLLLDVMNLLNNQEAVSIVQNQELAANTIDPDFLRTNRYQLPRQVRLGLRIEF